MGGVTLYTQMWIFPPLSQKLGYIKLYTIGSFIYLFIYMAFPSLSTFIAPNPDLKFWTWPLLLVTMSLRHVSNVFTFTSVMIMINNSAGKGKLGIVNGLGQTMAAFVRSIGPALGGTMWAWSLSDSHRFPYNYWFVFLVLVILGSITIIQILLIPVDVGKSADFDDDDDGNDDDDDEGGFYVSGGH